MKTKNYLIIYYICFVITILIIGFSNYNFISITTMSPDGKYVPGIFESILSGGLLYYLNVVLVLIFTFLIIKNKKLNVKNLLLPIAYIIFTIMVFGICFLFNNRVMIPYIQFNYYSKFILIGYLLLNIYSILSIKFKN